MLQQHRRRDINVVIPEKAEEFSLTGESGRPLVQPLTDRINRSVPSGQHLRGAKIQRLGKELLLRLSVFLQNPSLRIGTEDTLLFGIGHQNLHLAVNRFQKEPAGAFRRLFLPVFGEMDTPEIFQIGGQNGNRSLFIVENVQLAVIGRHILRQPEGFFLQFASIYHPVILITRRGGHRLVVAVVAVAFFRRRRAHTQAGRKQR